MPDKAVTLFIEDLLRRHALRDAEQNTEILFSGLTGDSLQTLLSNSSMQNVTAGTQLVQHGDTPSYLYFILEGRVKTMRYSNTGAESTLRMLKSSDTFMDAVIFMGGTSPVNAIALENSRLLLIPAETVRRHALHDSQFACNLLKIVTRHYKNALQQIDSIVTKNPVARLGYYFLKQHLEQGSESAEIALPFQKSAIANHLGMTPETFSRALNHIKQMGIDVENEKLTLRDAYALCQFCDPDTSYSCAKFNTGRCPLSDNSVKGCH